MTCNPKIVLLSLRQVDPFIEDGASRTWIGRLNALKELGAEVSLINYLPGSARNRRSMTALISQLGASECGSACAGSFHGIQTRHELLPYDETAVEEEYADLIRRMIRKLEEITPDFVFTVDEGLYPLTAVRLLGIPGAHSFHSLDNVLRCAAKPAYRRLLKHTTVISVSAYLKEQISTRMGSEAIVWNSVIEPDQTGPEKFPSVEKYDIGFSAGGQMKGDSVVKMIADRLPQYRFLIVGGWGTSELAVKQENLTCWWRIPDMPRFYRCIRLLLVPSLIPDAFPRVTLEAAAFGVPVIANRIGGIPEALGDSGVLMDMGDGGQPELDRLAERYVVEITRLLEDKDLYAEYSARALRRAREFDTQQKIRTREIYENVILKHFVNRSTAKRM